jgi:AraC family transcriptional regulator
MFEVPKLKHGHCTEKVTGIKLTAGGFRFSMSTFQTGQIVARHEHVLDQIRFIRSGDCKETFGANGHELALSAPAILFLPAGMPHSSIHHSESEHFVIEAERDELDSIDFMSSIPMQISVDTAMFDVHRLVREFESPQAESSGILKGLASIMFGHVDRVANSAFMAKQMPAWLKRVKHLIDSQFLRPWTLEELSYETGMDPEHLTTQFKNAFKLTPSAYLRMRRIHYSCVLIETSDRQLADIAIAAGFANQAHFARVFQYYMGVTPQAFKRCTRGIRGTGQPLPLRRARVDAWDDTGNDLLKLLPKAVNGDGER